MSLVSGHSKVCGEICGALGLKNVRTLDIHMPHDGMVVVKVELHPEEDGIKQMVPILKKYHLLEADEDDPTNEKYCGTCTYMYSSQRNSEPPCETCKGWLWKEKQKTTQNAAKTMSIEDQASILGIDKDKTWLENCWLAEASYGRTAWYAKSIDRNTIIGTTNAWESMKFNTQDECCDWIDSWTVPELEKSKYTPVNHGFVHEGEAIKEAEKC
jgi:hypothetical protein